MKIRLLITAALSVTAGLVNAQPVLGSDGMTEVANGEAFAGVVVSNLLLVLSILAIVYAGKKIYLLYKENKEGPLSHNGTHPEG